MPEADRRTWLGYAAAVATCCSPGWATAQEPPALAAISDPVERTRVRALIAAAREEAGLSWVGVQFEPDRAAAILSEFQRHYGLGGRETDYAYLATGEIITRVEEHLRGRRNTIDIVWTSSWSWYKDLLRRGEIGRYESPHYADYTLSDGAGMSEPGYWVSDAYTFSPLYGPAALAARGVTDTRPTSWSDFVDPRLSGAISMIDPLVSTSAAPVLAGVTKAMGEDWLRRLGAARPRLHARGAQGRDWVGSGEVAASLFGTPADVLTLRQRGIDARLAFPKEGVVLIPFAPIILASAPHPNTAKLFIDFVRSPDGAQMIASTTGALLVFGRPGVRTSRPDLLPPAEQIQAIPFDWNAEGSDQAIEAFRARVRAVGIGR